MTGLSRDKYVWNCSPSKSWCIFNITLIFINRIPIKCRHRISHAKSPTSPSSSRWTCFGWMRDNLHYWIAINANRHVIQLQYNINLPPFGYFLLISRFSIVREENSGRWIAYYSKLKQKISVIGIPRHCSSMYLIFRLNCGWSIANR